eukprot:6176214-Pleurochrysis_carterae.AAC.1
MSGAGLHAVQPLGKRSSSVLPGMTSSTAVRQRLDGQAAGGWCNCVGSPLPTASVMPLCLETVNSRSALGPSRLHVRGKKIWAYRLLMAQSPFRVWFQKHPGTHRTQLVLAFKLLILQEDESQVPPPGCHYGEDELNASKELAMDLLAAMGRKIMPLSPALLRLCGLSACSCTRQEDAAPEARAGEAAAQEGANDAGGSSGSGAGCAALNELSEVRSYEGHRGGYQTFSTPPQPAAAPLLPLLLPPTVTITPLIMASVSTGDEEHGSSRACRKAQCLAAASAAAETEHELRELKAKFDCELAAQMICAQRVELANLQSHLEEANAIACMLLELLGLDALKRLLTGKEEECATLKKSLASSERNLGVTARALVTHLRTAQQSQRRNNTKHQSAALPHSE